MGEGERSPTLSLSCLAPDWVLAASLKTIPFLLHVSTRNQLAHPNLPGTARNKAGIARKQLALRLETRNRSISFCPNVLRVGARPSNGASQVVVWIRAAVQ